MLAQALTEQQRWLQSANNLMPHESGAFGGRKKDRWEPPTLSKVEATDRAYEMADRWGRIALRNLRALRDLRRYGASVTIQNAGQVNFGGQQVNVAAKEVREAAERVYEGAVGIEG